MQPIAAQRTTAATAGGLTILRAASGRIATKRFSALHDGRIRKSSYGNERFFALEPAEADDIFVLAALVRRLERDPRAFIIRGAPLPHAQRQRARRLLHPDPSTGDGATIVTADRAWVMLDLDGVACPAGLDPRVPNDAEELIDHLTGLLPSEFHDATCYWVWSASQSVPERLGAVPPDQLRAHLFFWLDRPIADADLRRWASGLKKAGLPLDPSVFAPVQPHYVAAPVFVGMPDPLPRRSGLRPRLVDRVALVLPTPERPPRGGQSGVRAFDGSGVDFHLNRIGPDGYQEPIKATVGAFFAHHGADADGEIIKTAIRARIDAVSGSYPRSAGEIARYRSDRFLAGKIGWTQVRERADAAASPEAASLPPCFGEEGANRDGVLAEQRATIREWIARNHRVVHARREIERRRTVAFAEAGFVEDPFGAGRDDPGARGRKAVLSRRVRRQVLEEFGLARLPKHGERTLITGAQGTGKSRTVAEAIAELRGAVVIRWLVPTLEKAFEQALEYRRLAGPDSLPAWVVSGRGAADPEDPQTSMCPRHKVVNRAAAMGVNVQMEICETCGLRDICGYQRQRNRLSGAAGSGGLFITSAEYLWLPCPAPGAEIVVVDESIIGKATETISLDPRCVTEDGMWAGKQLGEAMRRREVAALVRRAVTDHRTRELAFLREQGVTLHDLQAALKHLASREDARPDVHGRMTDQAIARALDAVEVRETRKVLILFRQICREFERPRARLNSVWFEPQWRVMVDGEVSFEPRVFAGYIRAHRCTDSTPVLALDGTGSLALNRKVFGGRMLERRFPVPRDAEVIQVKGKVFSRQSLTGTSKYGSPISSTRTAAAEHLRDEVLTLLRMLSGEVLLVTYKAVEELLQPLLPPRIRVAHFGALRGLNAYEAYETVVVLGRQQPSTQAIEALARPFAADDDEPLFTFGGYVQQCRARRLRHRSPSIEVVQVHPDARCQDLLEQVREAEIVQAIDRVRPVFNRRRIIVLTNMALDLTVDHAVAWAELRPGKLACAFARHGVLPLSAGDLCRGFPDLWSSENTAKSDLSRAALIGCNPQRRILFGVCTLLDQPPLQATYRRRAQKGKPARALVRADLPDPRPVLESLVGELTEFHVERSTKPSGKADAPEPPAQRLTPLPPLAAALSAEGHLLATLLPGQRPPDMLGMAGVIKLRTLVAGPAGAQRTAVA